MKRRPQFAILPRHAAAIIRLGDPWHPRRHRRRSRQTRNRRPGIGGGAGRVPGLSRRDVRHPYPPAHSIPLRQRTCHRREVHPGGCLLLRFSRQDPPSAGTRCRPHPGALRGGAGMAGHRAGHAVEPGEAVPGPRRGFRGELRAFRAERDPLRRVGGGHAAASSRSAAGSSPSGRRTSTS